MKDLNLIFFEDAGHGWLRVKLTLLAELGITDEISGYSYQKGQYAYLEEDCDAPLFLEHAQTTYNIKITKKYTHTSPIRDYAGYNKNYPNRLSVGMSITFHNGNTGTIIDNPTNGYKNQWIVLLDDNSLTRFPKKNDLDYLK